MHEFFIQAGIIVALCSPTAAIIAYSVYKGDFSGARGGSVLIDERELDRREYETMLRHRRRAKLERQFAKSKV